MVENNENNSSISSSASEDEPLIPFTPDQIASRKLRVKSLVTSKVARINDKKVQTQKEVEEKATELDAQLKADPRYQQIDAVLSHPDMEALQEELASYIGGYVRGLADYDKPKFGVGSKNEIYPKKYLALIGKHDIVPGVTDEDILIRNLRGYAGVDLYSDGWCAWGCTFSMNWNPSANGMELTYNDSSEETYRKLSRLDETIDVVAETVSKPPVMFAREAREWYKFTSDNRYAFNAFVTMARSAGININPYIGFYEIKRLGIIDEVKVMVAQIGNEFTQTDLLKQIARNTGGLSQIASSTHNISVANQSSLSNINEQLRQLSEKVNRK